MPPTGKLAAGQIADVFELPHPVIGKIAHRSGGKRGQAGQGGGMMEAKHFSHQLKRLSLSFFSPPGALDDQVFPFCEDHHVGPASQEGIAADLLPPLDRFEQECVRLFCGNGQESRDRGQQVGGHRLHHGHQGGVARKTGEFLVIGNEHECPAIIRAAELTSRPGSLVPPEPRNPRFRPIAPSVENCRALCWPSGYPGKN